MAEPQPDSRNVARDAAVSSLISNAVYLAVMIGLGVVLTRRDWVEQQARRLQAAISREWRGWHTAREVADFRREVSEYEHKQDGGCGC